MPFGEEKLKGVDDDSMVSHPEAIVDAIAALKENGLGQKVVEGLQNYLSCEVRLLLDKKRAWLEQPHLIKSLKKFSEQVKRV